MFTVFVKRFFILLSCNLVDVEQFLRAWNDNSSNLIMIWFHYQTFLLGAIKNVSCVMRIKNGHFI